MMKAKILPFPHRGNPPRQKRTPRRRGRDQSARRQILHVLLYGLAALVSVLFAATLTVFTWHSLAPEAWRWLAGEQIIHLGYMVSVAALFMCAAFAIIPRNNNGERKSW